MSVSSGASLAPCRHRFTTCPYLLAPPWRHVDIVSPHVRIFWCLPGAMSTSFHHMSVSFGASLAPCRHRFTTCPYLLAPPWRHVDIVSPHVRIFWRLLGAISTSFHHMSVSFGLCMSARALHFRIFWALHEREGAPL